MLDRSTATFNHAPTGSKVRVWDLGVRLFHWLLVASVLGAMLTGFFAPRPLLDLHLVFGCVVAALLLHRTVWGFAGSAYSRFASFIVSPRSALEYAVALLRGRSVPHYAGHNPIGAMMIVTLLVVLTALTITGVVTLGGVLKDGPLGFATSFATGSTARAVHVALAYGLVALIGGHLAGIAAESLRTRENLVAAMFSGRKRVSGSALRDATAHPFVAAVLVATGVGCVGTIAAVSSMRPALGVPTAALDETYVKECGACHTPHHPSIAPAATWIAILENLDMHFGDNAELDPAAVRKLHAYLLAHSAERFDSKAANTFRDVTASETLPRVTESASWKRLHAKIEPAVFQAKPVSGRLNCQACHADAVSGGFKPRNISIPREISK